MGAIPLRSDDRVNTGRAESNEALVRAAQEGDVRAFEALYRRTSDRVYAVCLRMSGDSERATELVQDVFVRVWQKLPGFRGESQFTTWLHRLTVNLVLQERRSRGRREAREIGSEDLERYESESELALFREYRDVIGMFRYVIETDRRSYLANSVKRLSNADAERIEYELTDAWVWDMYRQSRFLAKVTIAGWKAIWIPSSM